MPVIAAVGLSKTFHVRRKAGLVRRARVDVAAVNDVSFTVERGEAVGYIGPNGAGKSTTIKMLTGILTPSSGSVQVAGLRPVRDRKALAHRIGAVFGQRTTLWWDLPLRDSFRMLRHIHHVAADVHERRLSHYVELLDLGPILDTPVRQLSLGQRMRGDLVAALLHDPEVLYLDEPTIGLDVVSKLAVRRFLAELNSERGTTIVLTTHDLDDIEQLCRRVMVIDHGRLAYDGGLAELRRQVITERTLVVELAVESAALTLPGTRVTRVEGTRQWLAFDAKANAGPLIAAVMKDHEVVDVAVREPDIEDVVLQLYAGSVSGR